nr:protein kinase-like domain, phloem protein 2-like protein [Tanacetum cinerariifolium]
MVLLNDNWEPKLPEFRLSMKIKASERHHSFRVDKVCDRDGKSVIANDTNKYLAPMAITHYREKRLQDIIDWDLWQQIDSESFNIFAETAYECLNKERSQRPNIDEIVPKLQKALKLACENRPIMSLPSNQFAHLKVPLRNFLSATNNFSQENFWRYDDFGIFYKGQLLWSGELIDICARRFNKEMNHRDQLFWTEISMLSTLKHKNMIMSLPSNQFAHLKVPLRNFLSATNNFSQENFWRYDDFGFFYKGQLLWSGELIDICARRFNKEMNDRDQLFWTEISMLSTLKHKNMVSLVGFCDENDEKIIINRHNTRGSLHNYLSNPMLLTWVRRLEICVSLAHALSYIHYDEPRDFSVIHRAINSSSVLLNSEWEPKLCDFERSMKIKASQRHHSFHTNKVKGVNGYADPIYIETKRVSHKSDMYSFGIVLFELLCGRRSIINSDSNKYLAPLATTYYREKRLDEIIDLDLWKQMDSQSINIFAETAYDCLNEEQSQRPNIDEIVTRLEKALHYA